MVGKERWRKHVRGLDIEGFPKSWISRGLQEIHHVGDQMDGRMDACLGYTAVLGAEIYESMGELRDDLREDQKKRALDGWERMDTKRQLEDSLCDAQGEIVNLKARVDTLEFLVEKLTCPVPEVPKEATFRVTSPPLPDIGFPPLMCHDFHLFTYFLLSSKHPNTCSNHDMALSYLILSFHTSKSHHQNEESR